MGRQLPFWECLQQLLCGGGVFAAPDMAIWAGGGHSSPLLCDRHQLGTADEASSSRCSKQSAETGHKLSTRLCPPGPLVARSLCASGSMAAACPLKLLGTLRGWLPICPDASTLSSFSCTCTQL